MTTDPRWKSQLGQDRFVWQTLDRKTGGTFFDIGAGHPEQISNTVVLERGFGWRGLLSDIEYDRQLREQRARNNIYRADATDIDYDAQWLRLASDEFRWVDFLSLDLEPPDLTARVLLRMPLDRIRFRIACVEHDAYRDGERGILRRDMMRSFMEWSGYVRVADIVVNMQTDDEIIEAHIEDWWVHRDSGLVEKARAVLGGDA
jgi:hypothetical protein